MLPGMVVNSFKNKHLVVTLCSVNSAFAARMARFYTQFCTLPLRHPPLPGSQLSAAPGVPAR